MAAGGDELFRRLAGLDRAARDAERELAKVRESARPDQAWLLDQAKANNRDAQQRYISALINEQDARHEHWSDVRNERDEARPERDQAPGAVGDELFDRVEQCRLAMDAADRGLQDTRDEVRFPRDVAELDSAQEIYMDRHGEYADELYSGQEERQAHWMETRQEVEGYRQDRAQEQEPEVETDLERRMREAYERQQEDLKQEQDGHNWEY